MAAPNQMAGAQNALQGPSPFQLKSGRGGGGGGGGAGFNRSPSGQIKSKEWLKSAAPSGGAAGGGRKPSGPAKPLSKTEATAKIARLKRLFNRCVMKNKHKERSDGYVWIRSNGESDGRLAKRGSAHVCLKNHKVACDDECPVSEAELCTCEGKTKDEAPAYGGAMPGGYPPPYQPYPPYLHYPAPSMKHAPAPAPYPNPYFTG